MNCFFFFLEMVSVIENINTDNDNDDSDAPVEITTKTSKTKKKKNTKRRIKYTLATEDDDDDPNEKHLDEESALTHLVFGDDDDYLEELTSGATKKLTVESKKPAWIDSEEVTEEMFVIFLRI